MGYHCLNTSHRPRVSCETVEAVKLVWDQLAGRQKSVYINLSTETLHNFTLHYIWAGIAHSI
jgi:hypothetical protein